MAEADDSVLLRIGDEGMTPWSTIILSTSNSA